jgi:membrane protein YqaA with SNARE-associated domain
MMDRLHEILTGILHWMESFANTPYGDWALFAIAFAESSFFPIPPDILLVALCSGQPERSLWFALLCSVGSVLGGTFGYGIGFFGGRPMMHRLFNVQKIKVVERYYDRWNAWATGIAGLTPLPYKIFTISAGAFAVNFKIFVLASILARSLRFFAVAGLIYFYGEPIKVFIEKYLNLLSIAFVLILVGSYFVIGRSAGRVSQETEGEQEV